MNAVLASGQAAYRIRYLRILTRQAPPILSTKAMRRIALVLLIVICLALVESVWIVATSLAQRQPRFLNEFVPALVLLDGIAINRRAIGCHHFEPQTG